MNGGRPLFDGWLMVDWSGAGVPRRGRDSIWLAWLHAGGLETHNPATRAEASERIAAILDTATRRGDRVLAGFDFPFGYPKGLAEAMAPGAVWSDVWARIAEEVREGPENGNDRFDAAARLNALFAAEGPFWGNGLKRDIRGLPRKKPVGWSVTLPANLRDADRRASAAQEVWKLSGAGSVGGQALTGIAMLERLRHATGAAVWPFETLGEGTGHVLAEVFPSLVPMTFPENAVRDRVQVETLVRAIARLDGDGHLADLLRAPERLPEEVRTHEATILGIDHRDLLSRAVREVEVEAPVPQAAGDGASHAGPRPAPVNGADGAAPATARAGSRLPPYEHDPAAIYAQSFATIRREARLDRFDGGMAAMAVRVIHACGMVEVADRLAFSPGAADAGRAALMAGKPVFCDSEMVGAGVIRRLLPAGNEVIVTLNDPLVPGKAQAIGNTRSAAAVELWLDRLEGAVVAIGNAPTALFHLLDLIDRGAPKPALILGFPVGFVGAAESKAELAANPRGCGFVALRGRRGGSAMAAAAVNALSAREAGA